jgi:two-component system, NtrC family, nitrogen regulation sensor histidine kinase NtrY
LKRFPLHKRRRWRRFLLLFAAAALLLLSFLTSSYFSSKLSVNYHQKNLQRYITAQERDAQQVIRDTVLMRKLVQHTESQQEFDWLTGKKYGLFLYAETIGDKADLLFWNTQKIIQPPSEVNFAAGDSLYFRQYLNGFYVTQTTRLSLPGMSNNIKAYVLIPVVYKYYLETENSQTQFAHNKDAIKKIAATKLPTDFPIYSLDKKVQN